MQSATLSIHRTAAPITVLGPGRRAVIWVQGCPFSCPGCIAPETRDISKGQQYSVAALAGWVVEQQDIEGITLSGGEPMYQAEPLASLIDQITSHQDVGVVCYTGYTYEALLDVGTPAQRALLERIDLLIDGPYLQSQHANLLWRGSENQRLILLTNRYRDLINSLSVETDTSAGIQLSVSNDGTPWYAGVPPQQYFRERFEEHLRARGVHLVKEEL